MRILFVGPNYRGSNGTSWRDAFIELGHDVEAVDDESFDPSPSTLVGKWIRKRRGRPAAEHVHALNSRIEQLAREFRPDLAFFVKAYHIAPETLDVLRRDAPCFAWMNDDMFNPANQSPTFAESIRLFDVILTTKSYNVREFHAAGAPRAVYIPNSYDPHIHFPAEVSESERAAYGGDIAFVGMFRQQRADFLNRVAVLSDLRLRVWGGGWHKMRRIDHLHKRLGWRPLWNCVQPQALWCEEMSKAFQSNAVTLGLLNPDNRDMQTCRTFEIPACGALMLAERTEEHRTFFEEDREAVYFSSFEEMIDKARFYAVHESERRRIAQAGYRRCLQSDYSIIDRARYALELVGANVIAR